MEEFFEQEQYEMEQERYEVPDYEQFERNCADEDMDDYRDEYEGEDEILDEMERVLG